MSYTHCKGCGVQLKRGFDQMDGLCSIAWEPLVSCFHKWRRWLVRQDACPKELAFEDLYVIAYDAPVRAVAIDQWLEKGAP